ncbi:uncharacterized protein LOC121626627 [Chelmon rostratus]|uniref:uncharacterized protein LOC121626627 n=1 Tax=Chelmon rostratus TaxID=109905 RepID=UPI001BE53A38|nr:uncharacterized protein LOC121626627 [Chelmon rostratus]XP_041821175.1 uncharacterized protein LOC121626627 [Chelmon rostratus]
MIFILVLVGLAFAVCGSVVNTTPTVYQAKENDNITIRWDITTKTELSLVRLLCFFLSKPLKVLYEMSYGVEVPESQHQQFAGRVQCDQDALREGRIRLHVSTVTADDSGSYRCELAANYDPTMGWTLRATEHFVLNVTSGGESADDFPDTPKLAEGGKHTPGGPRKEEDTSGYWNIVKTVFGAVNVGFLVAVGLILLVAAAVRCPAVFVCCGERRQIQTV